jgi:hypothetical protein
MLATTSSKIDREKERERERERKREREREGGLTGEREKLQNTRRPNLQFPLKFNRVVKYTKTKWLVHAGHFGKINAYKIISEKPEGQNPAGRYRSRRDITWAAQIK